MHSLFTLVLLLAAPPVLADKCDSSAYKLAVIALSNGNDDALERLRRSAKQYDVDFTAVDVPQRSIRQPENAEDYRARFRLLVTELEAFRTKDSTILLVFDGYDAVITGDGSDIICQFLAACSNCRTLLPALTAGIESEQSEFRSAVLIGIAANVLDVLSFIDSQDDNISPYNRLHADKNLESTLGLVFDTQRTLFQNVDSANREIMLSFQDSGDALVHNILYNTYPSVTFGSSEGSLLLNYLGNYIGKAWSAEDGCRQCCSNMHSLLETSEDEWPTITLALFITKPIPFVREFFATTSRLAYPTSKIDLYIYNNQKYNVKDVEEFVKNAKKLYRTVDYDNDDFELGDREARKTALTLAMKASNEFVFMLDGDVHLITKETLRLLVETATFAKLGIVAPLVTVGDKLFSNFWGALDKNGYYARSEDYVEIIEGKRVGIWNVPYVSGAILIGKGKMKVLADSYTYNLKVDSDMSFCEYARAKGHFLHVDNQRYYGFLVDSEDFINSGDKIHPEMYEIFKNRYLWEQRYVHPKYYEALNSTEIPQPCPDVYDYPLMSENFTQELIEEMEHYGRWSSGSNKDDRLAGGYENVPTVDIHMKQIDFEREWLYFLDEYVRPMQEKLFIGYYQSPVQAIMMFVVRYKQGEQPSLRAHHDASTYTVDIPLNKRGRDYEGGGVHYVRYNCTVAADQIGYAAMFPGRLTHLHEGLPVTSGIRYIAVSFLNP